MGVVLVKTFLCLVYGRTFTCARRVRNKQVSICEMVGIYTFFSVPPLE